MTEPYDPDDTRSFVDRYRQDVLVDEELRHRIDELESMWPDQSRLTAEIERLQGWVKFYQDFCDNYEAEIRNAALKEASDRLLDRCECWDEESQECQWCMVAREIRAQSA